MNERIESGRYVATRGLAFAALLELAPLVMLGAALAFLFVAVRFDNHGAPLIGAFGQLAAGGMMFSFVGGLGWFSLGNNRAGCAVLFLRGANVLAILWLLAWAFSGWDNPHATGPSGAMFLAAAIAYVAVPLVSAIALVLAPHRSPSAPPRGDV
jgi:hypothetical protein